MRKNNKMQKALSTLLVLFIFISTYSQSISNVELQRDGERVVIHYNFTGNNYLELYLWVSFDEGASWTGPLKSVEGKINGEIIRIRA